MINQLYKEKKMKIINFAVCTVIAVFVAVVAVPAQAADKPANKKPVAEKKVKKHKANDEEDELGDGSIQSSHRSRGVNPFRI